MLEIAITPAYHLKFLLAQVKWCCPISYCGVPFVTKIALGLEACNFEDKNRVDLASWTNKSRVLISREEVKH